VTDLAPAPSLLDLHPVALGEAVAAGLLAVPGLRVEPLDPAAAPALPGGDLRAVGIELPGAGRLVLVTTKDVARRLQVGPPPAEDLLDATQEALATAAAAAGTEPASGVAELEPTLAQPGAGEACVAAALLEGDEHVATVVLIGPEPVPEPETAAVHEFASLPQATPPPVAGGLELLHDVSLGVTAELGRTQMLVRDVLGLAPGAVIELDRAAGSPVDVLVNGTLIARGEVVVIDEEFGIRITEVVGYDDGRRA
jgi:flagellar motor switch protein FliN/FliY